MTSDAAFPIHDHGVKRFQGLGKVKIPLTLKSLAVSLRTTRFNIQIFYMVLALRRVFCTDIRTDRDLFGFYNHGGKCLLRGTD